VTINIVPRANYQSTTRRLRYAGVYYLGYPQSPV
jgi:hypothetical protein